MSTMQTNVANDILKILENNGSNLRMYAKDAAENQSPYLYNADTDEPIQSLLYDSAEAVLYDIVKANNNRQ